MRKPRSALVCLLLLGFSVSLAVPVEDNPETEYEESETLPFDATPRFTIVVPRASARIAEAEFRNTLRSASILRRNAVREVVETAHGRTASPIP